jgi:hypothetical protein
VVGRFPDVTNDAWYAEAVNYLVSLGILTGYPDGTFQPNAYITRAEFTAIVARIEALTTGSGASFADVQSDYWASGYIAAVFNKGWVNGFPDGLFHPGENIDRASAVKLTNAVLGRTAGTVPTVSPFPDLVRDHWAFGEFISATGK